MFLSICVPAYNRPEELVRLIESVDCDFYDLEICICEDKSPKRELIRNAVKNIKSKYEINYYENEVNLGYDANIRQFVTKAKGKWIIYMGDDDVFIPGRLNDYVEFLKNNDKCGYILRSYQNVYKDGSTEKFIYYDGNKYFKPGLDGYLNLYRKSTFISGFTFQREFAIDTLTDEFDSTLLYQLYILAEITLNHPSAYYSIPFTQAFEGGEFFFGSSEKEKGKYRPNVIDVEGQAYFIESYFKITEFIDKKYKIDSTKIIKLQMSKYSYPILAFVRNNGIHDFKLFKKRLCNIGINSSKLFYLYYYSLLILGVKPTKRIIKIIKKILGRTPNL